MKYSWSVSGGQGPSEGVCHCRTLRHKTHNTRTGDETMVAYVWHPWAARSVYVHDVIERAAGASARCSLVGDPVARVLELPVWMLDAAACRSVSLTADPIVALATLTAPQSLLSAAMPSMRRRDSPDARLASPEPHRGDRHATPDITPVSPSPDPSSPARPLPGERTIGGGSASMEHPAGPSSTHGNQPGHPPSDRARHRRRGQRKQPVEGSKR